MVEEQTRGKRRARLASVEQIKKEQTSLYWKAKKGCVASDGSISIDSLKTLNGVLMDLRETIKLDKLEREIDAARFLQLKIAQKAKTELQTVNR